MVNWLVSWSQVIILVTHNVRGRSQDRPFLLTNIVTLLYNYVTNLYTDYDSHN